jgi:hypothetical protein
MNIKKCIYLCNHINQDIEHFYHPKSPVLLASHKEVTYPDPDHFIHFICFTYATIQININTWYVLFLSDFHLNTVFWKFIHVSGSFLFFAQ